MKHTGLSGKPFKFTICSSAHQIVFYMLEFSFGQNSLLIRSRGSVNSSIALSSQDDNKITEVIILKIGQASYYAYEFVLYKYVYI